MLTKEKLFQIYEGWKNIVFPNPEVEVEAKKRMAICIECRRLKPNNFCSICGCYTPAKVRSPKQRCPLNLWQ